MFHSHHLLKLAIFNPSQVVTLIVNPSNSPPPFPILLVFPRYFAAFNNFLLETFVICAKFGIPNLPQSPDIGENSDEGISDFRISGQSLINKNWYNSRTSNDLIWNLDQ